MTLRSCPQWMKLSNCHIHTHKKIRLNIVFSSSNVCYYISDKLKNAKKKDTLPNL